MALKVLGPRALSTGRPGRQITSLTSSACSSSASSCLSWWLCSAMGSCYVPFDRWVNGGKGVSSTKIVAFAQESLGPPLLLDASRVFVIFKTEPISFINLETSAERLMSAAYSNQLYIPYHILNVCNNCYISAGCVKISNCGLTSSITSITPTVPFQQNMNGYNTLSRSQDGMITSVLHINCSPTHLNISTEPKLNSTKASRCWRLP